MPDLAHAIRPAVLVLWATLGALASACAPEDVRPPNLILIVADDMGFGEPGCYGNAAGVTPNLDRMAAEGVRFTAFHATAPSCLPSRLALLTGRDQHRVAPEWRGGDWVPQDDVEPLAAAMADSLGPVLQRAGYSTALIGKWGLGTREVQHPNNSGFDRFVGQLGGVVDYVSHVNPKGYFDWWSDLEQDQSPGYVTDLVTEASVAFIRQNADRPFFLMVSHAAPHLPYQAPGDAPVYRLGRASSYENRPVEEIRPTYVAMVAALDASVGTLLATLAELDLAERTLVLFVSDNGANRYGLNTPFRGGKNELWNGGVQVPAIAWWPGAIAPGRVVDDVVSALDVTPTLIELADGPPVESTRSVCDGMSLVGTLLHGEPVEERTLCWQHVAGDGTILRAARRGRWKLLRSGEQVALFDLQTDPGEEHDLADGHPERVASLSTALQRWWTDLGRD